MSKYNGFTNHKTGLLNVWSRPNSPTYVEVDQKAIEDAYGKAPNSLHRFINDPIDWAELRAMHPIAVEKGTQS